MPGNEKRKFPFSALSGTRLIVVSPGGVLEVIFPLEKQSPYMDSLRKDDVGNKTE